MKVSRLIELLTAFRDEEGDREVTIVDTEDARVYEGDFKLGVEEAPRGQPHTCGIWIGGCQVFGEKIDHSEDDPDERGRRDLSR